MRLLVIRTSAMGDVAFTTPVIAGMLKQYPEAEMLLLTRKPFGAFFTESDRLKLFLPDLKGRHKGLGGIFRLFRDLNETGKIDSVIDLHNVLRSRILGVLFSMKGVPVSVINKGRKEKRDLIIGRIRRQLSHSAERYRETFRKAGFPVKTSEGPWIIPSGQAAGKVSALFDTTGVINVGVAPFAKHDLKVWPEEYMIKLLSVIAEGRKVKFWMFGGKEDMAKLEVLAGKIPDSQIVAGSFSLDEELALMNRLDFMIAMDSSNMHMAALVGTKVISIWGGTDPLAGFSAYGQPDEYSVRIPVEELTCRPCTVFGKGKCKRGDFACMNWLTPEKVYDKIVSLKIL
jgi:ADP-heptose:LPS heptosyltransferase